MQYQKPLIHFLYGFVRNEATSCDLAQEVFVKAYRSLDQYDGRASFSTWLFAIGSNHAKAYLRKNRLPEARLEEAENEIPETAPAPDQHAVSSEFKDVLEKSLADLPIEYREPLVLRHMSNCSMEEIAETLQIPLGTVKTRLFRGREMLQNILLKKWGKA